MTNILDDIIATKKAMLSQQRIQHPFYDALAKPGLSIIAEIKRHSPSRGLISDIVNPSQLAHQYESSGADAVSVLTDEPYFKGHIKDLIAVKKTVSLPILQKDFIISHQQIIEAIKIGANAVLLIMAALNEKLAHSLFLFAKDCGLDILVETHNADEIDRAIHLGANIIGVNNRNLNSFNTSIETSLKLIDKLPKNIIKVSESGIHSAEHAQHLAQAGFDALLIGEALVTADDSTPLIQQFKCAGPIK